MTSRIKFGQPIGFHGLMLNAGIKYYMIVASDEDGVLNTNQVIPFDSFAALKNALIQRVDTLLKINEDQEVDTFYSDRHNRVEWYLNSNYMYEIQTGQLSKKELKEMRESVAAVCEIEDD